MKTTAPLFSFILLLATAMTSCNQLEKTSSGMAFKISRGGGSVKLKQGDIYKFNIEYKLQNKDTVLNTSYGHLPAYNMYDTAHVRKYSFAEVIPNMFVGDKADFVVLIDSLKSMGMIREYDNVFQKGNFIAGKIELLKSFSSEAEARKDIDNESELEKGREIKDLQAYIAKNNLKATPTPAGTYVVIDNPGDASNKADTGKQLTVNYKGYTMDGKVFDQNDGKGGRPPFQLVLGSHRVIPGWEDGLTYFAKGAKGKILVPAMLGYRDQSPSPDIKPFSNLIFDIEVTDVTAAPPVAAQGMGDEKTAIENLQKKLGAKGKEEAKEK